jgi:hypothetical protein
MHVSRLLRRAVKRLQAVATAEDERFQASAAG